MATCIGRRNIKYLLGLVTFTGMALYLLLLILIFKCMYHSNLVFKSDYTRELTFIILNIVSLILTLVHLNPFIYTTWRNAS
jgi:fumarate reductase subunit C